MNLRASAKEIPSRSTTGRAIIVVLAIIAGLALGLPAAAASAPWPSSWTPYSFADGSPVLDVGGDENPGYTDIWSGAASGLGTLPTVYVGTDGSNIFFRMRAKADPEVNKGGSFSSTVYLVQIAIGGVTKAIVGLDGKPAGVNDIVYASNAADTETATAYDPVVPDGGATGGARAVNDGAGGYFVDFQLPISVITSVAPEVTPTAPVQFFFGTSTSNTNINKDFMTGNGVSYAGLATVTLDGSPAGDTSTEVAITSPTSTSSSNPTVSGTGEPGATIDVAVDGQTLTTTVDPIGTWSVTVPTALDDGVYAVEVTATDGAGNTATASQTLAVDAGTTVTVVSPPLTNQSNPVISGTGEPGATIDVSVDGQLMTTTVAPDGTWDVVVPIALIDGSYAVVVIATDGAGNTATANQTLTVDTTTSAAVTSPASTNDPTPTVFGTGEPGSTLAITIDGQVLTGLVDGSGNWSVTVPAVLADGTHTLSVTATDLAGNTNVTTQDLTVDTGTWVAVTSPAFTNDATPSIDGVGEPGATIELVVAGQTLTTAVANDGTWSVTVPGTLGDGSHLVTVTATDLLGFTAESTQNLTVDATTSVTLVPPGTTDNPTPTLTGVGEPAATIEMTVGGQTLTGVVDGSGSWSITVPSALDDGDYTVSVTATDLAGNVDTDSQPLTVDSRTTVGITSPALTTSPTPTITGTGEPGADVTVVIGAQVLATTVAPGGTWSVLVPIGLADGAHTVSVTAADALGNTAATTQPLTVDSATTVAISSPTLTSDTTPTISGSGEPGSTIELTVDGQTLSGVVDATGTWSINVPLALVDGTYLVSVTATDLAGNTAVTAQNLTIDATTFVKITSPALIASSLPTITGEAEADAAIEVTIGTETINVTAGSDGTWSVTATVPLADGNYVVPVSATVVDAPGNTASTSQNVTIDTITAVTISSPSATTDPTPSVSGAGEPGSTIALTVDGQTLSGVVDGTGSWSIAVPVALDDGTYPVSVTATDLAGNTATTTQNLTIDSQTFAAITSPPLTLSPTPIISGTGEPGSSISVSVGLQTLTATVANDGTWATPAATTLTDGTYPVTVTATDALGNTATTTQNLTVDTSTTVTITSDPATDNRTPSVSGTGEPGSTIALTVDGQTLSGVVDGTGSWSIAVPVALDDGTYPVSVTATDLAGNTATTTQNLTIDSQTFAAITSPPLTLSPTPIISGTGEPGSSISVSVGLQTLTATVANDGTWATPAATTLTDGTYPVTVTATDALGNTATTTQNLTVDTSTTVTITSDPATDNRTPSVSGTGEPGSTIALTVDGQTLSGVVDGTGSWSIAVPVALDDGTYPVSVTATDLAGNTATTTQNLTIDSQTFVAITSPPLTLSPTPIISGTGEPGSSISVSVGLQTLTATVANDGTWATPAATTLTDGTYPVTVTATDALGNTATTTQNLTVDTSTTVTITSDPATNDDTPLIVGTGEPFASISVLVDGQTLTTTVAGSGTWSVTVPASLGDATHAVSVTATDLLGNTASTSQDLLVDTVTVVSITSPLLTNDDTPEIGGLGVPGDSIVVSVSGQTITTIVAPDGTWSVSVPVALLDGDHSVSVTATDPVGNTATSTQVATVDTSLAAVVTSPTIGNDPTPTISGTGEPGAAITIVLEDSILSTTVGTDGTWSVDAPSDLTDGTHTAQITVSDPAGNTKTFSHTLTIDTVAQLITNDPGIVADSTPTIFGTGEPGSTVNVTAAGQTIATTVGADETWSVTFAQPLADGSYPVDITVVDVLGNTHSSTWTLQVDTVATLGVTQQQVTGDVVTGSGEPGATVTVTIAEVTTVVAVGADGVWSVPLPPGLVSGDHQIQVSIRDTAGNTNQSAFTITVPESGPQPGSIVQLLAATGSPTSTLIRMALVLALVGAFLRTVAGRESPIRPRWD